MAPDRAVVLGVRRAAPSTRRLAPLALIATFLGAGRLGLAGGCHDVLAWVCHSPSCGPRLASWRHWRASRPHGRQPAPRRRTAAAASDNALREGGVLASSVADLDIDAVTSLVRREIGVKNRTLGEVPSISPSRQIQPMRGIQDQLTMIDNAPEVIELMTSADPAALSVDDIALACRRMTLRPKTISDAMVQDWRFARFMKVAREVIGSSTMEPRHVATLLWSMSMLSRALPELQELLPEVCSAVSAAAPDMNLQNLTSSLSSVAKLYQRSPSALRAVDPLLNQILMKADSLDTSQLSMAVWAAGELELPEEQIYTVTDALLSSLTLDDLRRFKMQELANFIWGLANMGERDEGLLKAAADIVAKMAPRMSPKEVALDLPMLLCGFQRLMYRDEHFLQLMAVRLTMDRKTIRRMNRWGLCALSWAWPDVTDGHIGGHIRTVRELINEQLTKKRLTLEQVERSILGPGRWGGD